MYTPSNAGVHTGNVTCSEDKGDSPDTLDVRFIHEDIGVGLVMFCSLGRVLGVPTPACDAMVRMGSVVSGRDYFAESARTLDNLGLGGMTAAALKRYVETGQR